MIWLMEISKIYQKEQLQKKFEEIKHLIQEIKKVMDIEKVFLLCFKKFLIKRSLDSGIRKEIKQNQQLLDEIHKPIIKKCKKEKFIHDLMTIFRVPI